MTDDLVKRLRFELRDWDGASRFHFPEVNALLVRDAADRIEELTAENERLREALEWAADHVPWIVEEIYARAALGDTQ